MNTSISPPVAATPVAEVPVTLPIGDAGLSFNDCGTSLQSPKCCAGQPHSREVQAALGTNNDCGGVDGDTHANDARHPRAVRAERGPNSGISPLSRFDSGPQSPMCLAAERSTRAEAIRIDASECGRPPSFNSLQAEFVAVSLAWFAVLGATAIGGLL